MNIAMLKRLIKLTEAVIVLCSGENSGLENLKAIENWKTTERLSKMFEYFCRGFLSTLQTLKSLQSNNSSTGISERL